MKLPMTESGGSFMEKLKSLDWYQKTLLILMAVLLSVFAVIYYRTVSRVGFSYQDTILVPTQEESCTRYSGKIRGQQASFTVTADKSVTFQYGDKTYGPYRAKEDPTAVPEDEETGRYMTGVELWEGDQLIFRGGVLKTDQGLWLYSEDGEFSGLEITFLSGTDMTVQDEHGNIIDPMEPSASTVLELMGDPELTHKGDWSGWFGGAVIFLLTTISILFADELFRWQMAFRISNSDHVEPSEWEITGRYFGWTVFGILMLAILILGLE